MLNPPARLHGGAASGIVASMALHVQPLTAAIGAEITGIDLREALDEAAIDEVRAALHRHLVLFFRDQDVSLDDHVRFSSYFGPLVVGKGQRTTDSVPGINKLDQVAPVGQGADDWHSDHMFMPEPPLGTMLRSVQLPSVGGDTCFVSMYAAYDSLSPAMKAFLEPLTAMNSAAPVVARVKGKGIYANDIEKDLHPPVSHPVIRVHPETGRKSLFVCANYTTRINELNEAESDALLRMLFEHVRSPQHQCRFHWTPNALAFWDNRVTQHCAIPDYQERRVMYRTMIEGSAPYGVAAR